MIVGSVGVDNSRRNAGDKGGKDVACKQIALIRGINVGRAKRVAMVDLRTLVEDLGYDDVRTLLNSGNVIFTAVEQNTVDSAARIEEALSTRLGVSARVLVFTAAELAAIVTDNPLGEVVNDPSRLLVAFLENPVAVTRLKPLELQDWTPEVLAIGARVVYIWCPDGILASRLNVAVVRVLGDAVTTRNWATVMKLYALTKNQA